MFVLVLQTTLKTTLGVIRDVTENLSPMPNRRGNVEQDVSTLDRDALEAAASCQLAFCSTLYKVYTI